MYFFDDLNDEEVRTEFDKLKESLNLFRDPQTGPLDPDQI